KNEEKKKKSNSKESLFDFSEYLNKEVSVSLYGGRNIKGIIKSYDQLSNLIMDDVEEHINDLYTRKLGLVFIKGSSVIYYINVSI
ncbi:MAG: hypothetical protein MJ252_30260, partial [archaeon]|nr:hypothetical protein [archaeon]